MRTLYLASARRAATTDPADPDPTTMKSNSLPLAGKAGQSEAHTLRTSCVTRMYEPKKRPDRTHSTRPSVGFMAAVACSLTE